MVSVPQSSWFCSLSPIKGGVSSTTTNPRNCPFKTVTLKVSSSSFGHSNAESSSANASDSQEKSLEAERAETDPVKVAFAKAKAYKKIIQSNPIPKENQNPVSESAERENSSDGSVSEVTSCGNQEVPPAIKLAMEKAKQYKKNRGLVGSSEVVKGSETISESSERGNISDGSVSEVTDGGNQEVPLAVKVAVEKAKEYKNKRVVDSSKIVEGRETISGLKGENPRNGFFEKKVDKKEDLTISSIDFMGLNFSDKKNSRQLPAGLAPTVDPFPEGDLPEVEIIVGDTSKFGDATVLKPKPIQEDNSDLYKPKVSTWGVFPRPSNISKTYGGGKIIRPGEMLETAEDKADKEARTRQLLAAYKSKIGLNIDPKLKSECEKALKDGDSLMDLGNLKEALPYYEKIMDKLPFQSELHGLAALQWSICQDSLSRSNEARVMYESLQSHPNAQVRKKAMQFMFSFQAMEMMKVKSSTLSPMNTGYQNYFEAFIEDKANYPLKEAEVEQGALSQALPYILFLVSPIFIVLLIAVQKGI
ncbi:hypothetical protein F0562_027009 [Nyssa sinensis]|uniref:Uncharacterized protein n=1 Tax=Nyssa sinensis TaxID=561372 RepID=A0A5J5B422_9ASTE|nr:hypothetical protein F0562_027009 [Nyssa sinensis]